MSEVAEIYAATRAGGMRFYHEIREVRAYPSNALKYLVVISRWHYDREIERDFLMAETEQDIKPLIDIWVQDRLVRYAKRAEETDARLAWKWKVQRAKEARYGIDD